MLQLLEDQEEMKKEYQLLRQQLLTLEEEVRSKSSSSCSSSNPIRKKFKITRDLTVQANIELGVNVCLILS